ncbi:protein lines [Pectinophora gossypiella]|uniref:protein lines n=1 Tax=Pectinophora gossypiella TaxID=13191 RepID=UPI00214EF3B5|nr:protein lines [Pectinophora gossypiella]
MVLRGQLHCGPQTDEGMASDQPVKKKLRIDAPDIDDGSDRSAEDVITDIFDTETPPAETAEEFPTRNGESPDSGTVSEDAVDCSAILRLPNDSGVEIIPSCSNTAPHWRSDDNKLLTELRSLQDALVGQCLCRFDENVVTQLFDRQLNIVSWPMTCSLTYLSTMQLMFDVYLKQNSTGTICSKIMGACDILVRNRHDWITEVVELADHKSKFVTFVASRVLASFLIVSKDTVDENWLQQIAENIYLFDRINRITVQKINFSLDIIKRIVEWKDVEQHPLEDSHYINTAGNLQVQEDNPFRSSVGYNANQASSSHSNLHNAFSNLQTNSTPSTSAGDEPPERPVTFKLHEPVLKLDRSDQGEPDRSISPDPVPSRIERVNENGCVTVILTDSESFDTSHIKCLTIKTLEHHWPVLVKNMKLLLLRYLNLANAENCILTFFSLWENIISVKANLSVIDTKPFYADLQGFVDLLRNTMLPSLIYTHLLSLFNEVLCYGSTLALQDILPEEICGLAHSIVRFVKDFRLLSDIRVQNSRSGFGFLGHECQVIRDYTLGPEVAPLTATIQLVDQSYGDDEHDDSNQSRSEVDKTMLQRMSLLVLKSIAVTVKEMRCDSSDSSIDSSDYNAIQDMQIVERSIRDVLKKLDVFIRNSLEFHPETPFTKMLIHLFSEQDDYLIESMVCTLDITVGIVYRNSMYPDLIPMLNPIASFIEFLKVVSHDSDVLLDYLVSNETCFLLYLLRFLKYVRRNWPKFLETCQQSDSGGTRGLDDTMRVLIRLRLQISRLVSKSLFPYNISPVLRLLEVCESLYEGNEFS